MKVQELQIVLRATQTLHLLIFFKKIVLSDAHSEIHLVGRNIVPTGLGIKNLSGLNRSYIQA